MLCTENEIEDFVERAVAFLHTLLADWPLLPGMQRHVVFPLNVAVQAIADDLQTLLGLTIDVSYATLQWKKIEETGLKKEGLRKAVLIMTFGPFRSEEARARAESTKPLEYYEAAVRRLSDPASLRGARDDIQKHKERLEAAKAALERVQGTAHRVATTPLIVPSIVPSIL